MPDYLHFEGTIGYYLGWQSTEVTTTTSFYVSSYFTCNQNSCMPPAGMRLLYSLFYNDGKSGTNSKRKQLLTTSKWERDSLLKTSGWSCDIFQTTNWAAGGRNADPTSPADGDCVLGFVY